MGPIAGLAAGLGLAALASHLGMGEEFGNLLMIMLVALVAVLAIRFVMRRFGPAAQNRGDAATAQGLQYAGAGATPDRGWTSQPGVGAPTATPGMAPAMAPTGPALPAGFDSAGFERIAKLIFIRMQAANDRADLEDLRQFATPEMFAVFKLDLQDRKGAPQQTDVVQLDAQVLDFAQEDAPPGRERALSRPDPRSQGRCSLAVRRGLAPRQACRRQPRMGDRRDRADRLSRQGARFTPGAAASFALTSSTGTLARRAIISASLPISSRPTPRRPCVPSTIRSARQRLACSTT